MLDTEAGGSGADADHEERTDPETGYGARTSLIADLEDAVQPGNPSRTLAIFDLGGLADYVELYGRLEGVSLLNRIADRLSEAIDLPARFYRPRADELAVLIDAPLQTADSVLAQVVGALNDRFVQFRLALAFGAVMLPDETDDPIEALALADQQLFVHAEARKARERRSVPREPDGR